MRRNSIFLTLTTVLLISQFLFSQTLFLPHNIEPHQYRNMLTKYADLDAILLLVKPLSSYSTKSTNELLN